jgi:Spy/CpxP family protein refolding chaperone
LIVKEARKHLLIAFFPCKKYKKVFIRPNSQKPLTRQPYKKATISIKPSSYNRVYYKTIDTMKQLLTILLLTAALAQGAAAQIRRTVPEKQKTDSAGMPVPAQDEKTKRKEMLKELNLTKAQKGKFKEMRKEAKDKKEAIEGYEKLSQEEKDEQLKELKKEQLKKTDTLLTDEQKEKFKQLRKKDKTEKPRRGVTGLPNERGAGETPKEQQ